MKEMVFTSIFIFLTFFTYAQNKTGDEHKQDGNLEAAILAYKAEFNKDPENQKIAYKLASTFALGYMVDSSFYYLNRALKDDDSLWPLADTELYALIDDPRWKEIENEQIRKFQIKNHKLQQPEYAKSLLRIIIKDQVMDYYIDQAKVFYMQNGYAPHWFYPLGQAKKEIGGNNFEEVMALIEKYGWPTYSMVGDLAADAPLLVINHHESDSIRKAFLPKIEKACLEGEGSCMEYAKIHDRILVNEDKPQVYGMQFRYNDKQQLEPFPIKDPEFVDKRRKKIGLEPIKVYLKRKINYDWTVAQRD